MRSLAALFALALTAQTATAQHAGSQTTTPCIERVVMNRHGELRVQRYTWQSGPYGPGWYPVSDRRTCNESRLAVLKPSQPTPQSKPNMPTINKPLDCDPTQTYICRVYQKVNNVRALVRVGNGWHPLGIFTTVHSGQEMVAYVAVDNPDGKKLLCTLTDWQQHMRRATLPEPVVVPGPSMQAAPAAPVAPAAPSAPSAPTGKVIDTKTKGSGV